MTSSSNTPWIKARSSDATGSCVEMRGHDGRIQVRDTKQHGAGPVLQVTPAEFAAWIGAAKQGELDNLLG